MLLIWEVKSMDYIENIAIGIDLGTYNSAASVNLGDGPIMLQAKEGLTDQGISFPSFVEFDGQGEFLRAGEYARRSIQANPERVVWGVKRLIGKSYDQVKKSGDLERFQYKVFKGRDGSCRIKVGKREYSPTEISSFVLRKIKEDAEANFNPIGFPVTEATITVPAYFGPFQKAETEQAARMAGFDKVHLIPEPTAAALAYKLRVEKQNQYIAVIDLGAGTLDVTIALLYLDNDGALQTTEKGHGGDTTLGGLDIDDVILQDITKKHRLHSVMKDSSGKAKLRAEIERVKIELSTKQQAQMRFSFSKGNVDVQVSRRDIESAMYPIVQRCQGPIRIALQEANLQPQDVSHVLLVGGPTKMPIIRKLIIDEFAKNPNVVQEIRSIDHEGFPVNPMEAVARGAILGMFGGITPHAYGIMLYGSYYEMIPRRTRYPCSNSTSHIVSGRKRSMTLSLIQKAVDPQNYQEVYMMLGIFQFDYRPESGQTSIQIEAEYTDNGVLNLQVLQPSTMVGLPLYNVSKLEGKKISKPSTPLPITPPTINVQPPGPSGGGGPFGRGGPGGQPGGQPLAESWSQDELQVAIRISNRLTQVAQARLHQTSIEDKERIEGIVSNINQWKGNSWEDINIRTPQIRNLNKSLLHALITSRLIDPQEARELQKGIE
jgi:molecular chaperone DnaK